MSIKPVTSKDLAQSLDGKGIALVVVVNHDSKAVSPAAAVNIDAGGEEDNKQAMENALGCAQALVRQMVQFYADQFNIPMAEAQSTVATLAAHYETTGSIVNGLKRKDDHE